MPTTEGDQPDRVDGEQSQEIPAAASSRLNTAELEELVDAALSVRAPPAPPEPDPYLGLVIDRRYVIESLIAAGGMGLVYRCRHSVLGKRLAIKIIRGDVAQMPDGTDRFLVEAKAASAIGHEHIVDIADFGALPDGSPYLVMEYLDGISLAALLRDEAALRVPRIARLATQIADGLGAAHAAGIVHRDLKPDNVFVLERKGEDFIKILDFGVARMAQNAKKLTQAGTIVGTPHYMSPEQALGLEVDHRGDIYALGVILYELLARRVPFDGSHYVVVLNQHLHAPPPPFSSLDPPAEVPSKLEQIVNRCLAKVPEDRFQTMAELARALAPFRETDELAPSTGRDDSGAGESAGSIGGGDASANASIVATSKLPLSAVSRPGSGDAPLELPGPSSPLATSARPAPVPTVSLPAPSPTLVLPRLSGLFSIQQKRFVSTFSLLVLIGVCIAAALRLKDQEERGAAVPLEPVAPAVSVPAAPPAVPREPVPAPPIAPASVPAAEAPRPPPPERAPSRARPTSPSSPAASGKPSAPAPSRPRVESPAQALDRREAGPIKRPRSSRSSPSTKPRAKDEFINPWPSPR